MAFIFDHLIAVLVGGVVILALIVLQRDTQTSNTQTIGAEVTRSALVDFVEVIEHDLRNVASPDTSSALIAWTNTMPGAGATVTVLDFWSVIDTSLTAVPQRVQYELALTDSATVTSAVTPTKVPLYTLRRLVESGGTFSPQGESPYGLTEFAITPLDRFNATATTSSTARSLALATAFLPRWGGERVVNDIRFETIFRPPGLSF